MAELIDRLGEVHGDLEVVARANNNPQGEAMWWCRCKCGNYTLARSSDLRKGHKKSCGCYMKKRAHDTHIKHGMSGTRQYDIFNHMHQRCEDNNCPDYHNYGERDIKVCPEWATFEGFWADMEEGYADNLTLERIDVNGDYCRENCCWVDRKKQARNKRNTRKITIKGKTQTLIEHIEDPEINIYNLKEGAVRSRKKRGWSEEKIFSTPLEDDPTYTINGKTQTLAQHVADPEINIHDLKYRTVERRFYGLGWTLKEIFSTSVGYNHPVYTIKGKIQTLAQHVADPEINIYKLKLGTVWSRIRDLGWTPEEAFSTPMKDDRILIGGKYQTLSQHIADPEINVYGLKKGAVIKRRKLGWALDEIFSTPSGGKRKGH